MNLVTMAILPVLAVLVGGCSETAPRGTVSTPPPPEVLSRRVAIGNQPVPTEARPGIHFRGGKVPYIILVLKKGNPGVPEEVSTSVGPVSYDLEWRQDGERDASGEVITPVMDGTMTLRLHSPARVPVLVRQWLRPKTQEFVHENTFGGKPYETRSDVYEDLWVAGGEQVLTCRTGP